MEGQLKDSLQYGEWYYYDSLGRKERMIEYFVFKHKIHPNNRFIQYGKDSLGNPLESLNYTINSKINSISEGDTLYDFHIHVNCHLLDSVRVIYGLKDFEHDSDYTNADTLYPTNNGDFVIPKINCRKASNRLGEVQCYKKNVVIEGKLSTDVVKSHFFLSPDSK